MHLIWATKDYTIGGRPYPGFPIVLDDDMQSVAEVNQFLRHYLTRGVIGSPRSWPNTGRALYDYFGFLEVHGDDGAVAIEAPIAAPPVAIRLLTGI